MPNLKKVISLSQASKISGYHSDYLSALIRKGEMQGRKIGGNWFTSEEEIRNYIFKQETRNKKWFIKSFLYLKRINRGFLYASIALVIFVAGIYFYNDKYSEIEEIESKIIETKISDQNQEDVRIEGELQF